MGTTAEKLAYLNDTKTVIKDAIASKGVEVPEGTTFRQYADLISGISTGTPSIPSGSQSFTDSGTFTAPHTGLYTVILTAGHAASGDGGKAGNGHAKTTMNPSLYIYYLGMASGGSGGSGGGACICTSPGIMSCLLQEGDTIEITCNSSVVSFGNLFSISSGTAGGNGGNGTEGNVYVTSSSSQMISATGGKGGSAGIGGTPHNYFIAEDDRIRYSLPPTVQTENAPSGEKGNDGNADHGTPQYLDSSYALGVKGAFYSTAAVWMGGIGGDSANAPYYATNVTGERTYPPSVSPKDGIPAASGRIDIMWGTE